MDKLNNSVMDSMPLYIIVTVPVFMLVRDIK